MHLTDQTSAVLVVDDEFLLRICAVDSIHDEGLNTFEAGAASEALALLNAHPEVEVLFTDINIVGRVSGLELAHEVSRIRPDVRVIITSGRVQPSPDEMPANSVFVPKPYQMEHVARLIGRLCSERSSLV